MDGAGSTISHPDRTPVTPEGPSQLAVMFAVDAYELIRIGVAVNTGSMFATGAGLGAAALTAARGHWLLGVAVAVGGLLVGEGAREYKHKRFIGVRDKWVRVLAGLPEAEQLRFLKDIRTHYPALVPSLREHALGGSVVRRIIEGHPHDAVLSNYWG
jgi:hypothetical protein